MIINPVICSQCGAPIKINALSTVLICSSCGTSFLTNYKEISAKTNSVNYGSDKPIDIKISKIEQPIIRGSIRSGNLKELLEILSIISYYQKQEYICDINEFFDIYCYVSKEKLDSTGKQEQHYLELIDYYDKNLPKWGFEIVNRVHKIHHLPEEVTKNYRRDGEKYNDSKLEYQIAGTVRVTPSYYNIIWNKEIGDIVHRMLSNDTINQLANTISEQLIQKERIVVERKIDGVQLEQILVFEECLIYKKDCYYDVPHKSILGYQGRVDFHNLGFNNLSTKELRIAFSISLYILTTHKLNNRWYLQKFENQEYVPGFDGDGDTPASTNITLISKAKLEKQYKDW